MQICASLNHSKKMKTEPSRLIPRKLTANLELLIVNVKGKEVLNTAVFYFDFIHQKLGFGDDLRLSVNHCLNFAAPDVCVLLHLSAEPQRVLPPVHDNLPQTGLPLKEKELPFSCKFQFFDLKQKNPNHFKHS